MIKNTYDCVLIYLFSLVQKGRYLSKDSAMRASTHNIFTPFLVYFLFIIVIIIVDI